MSTIFKNLAVSNVKMTFKTKLKPVISKHKVTKHYI